MSNALVPIQDRSITTMVAHLAISRDWLAAREVEFVRVQQRVNCLHFTDSNHVLHCRRFINPGGMCIRWTQPVSPNVRGIVDPDVFFLCPACAHAVGIVRIL